MASELPDTPTTGQPFTPVLDVRWTCKCCGEQFSTLSFAYVFNEPDRWRAIPPQEREQRCVLTSDGCVIDGREFYVRSRLIVPVIDARQPFIWSVWVSLAQTHFERINELWNTEVRDTEPTLFGFLANEITVYPRTRNLKCSLRLKNAGIRPAVELEHSDHPLSAEQRHGITVERVMEIAAAAMGHTPKQASR
jgi:hypothetical protein